jgi:MFS family permease
MKKWFIVIVLSCAQFVMVLDSTVMNVSISTVVADLGTSVTGMQAAITFYTLTMAALMLTGAKLGDRWGRLKAFRIGSVVYALGSLITAFSPNLAALMIGWSVIEGLGAVLVIPAIAALIAVNYKGKDRIIGYTMIGAASGVAVAAGPLIGGYTTTYLSWRYVFIAEVVVMICVLIASRYMQEQRTKMPKVHIDLPSVFLSAVGMTLLVLGILQTKSWGLITPKAYPEIAGVEIAPLGISLCAYLIVIGIYIIKLFIDRQRKLEQQNGQPLLKVSMLSIKVLRSGLAVLSAQYVITAAIFFVMPIYLQMVLGLDALQTGIRIFPLSVAIVLFSVIGSRLSTTHSPQKIVRLGQLSLVAGSVVLLYAISPDLNGWIFATAMFVVGIGLGLLASQLGNINMSAVPEKLSSEVGGLQGTFQNLGSSLGTAIIGSVMIASLTSGFIDSVAANPSLPETVKTTINENSKAGIPIASTTDVEKYAIQAGLPAEEAATLANDYGTSQLRSLKASMFFLVLLALFTIYFSKNLPNTVPYKAK